MIEVRKVSKIYGRRSTVFRALDDISFTINDGESVAIVGKSGSGKSTLMHIMSGLDHPTSGSVVVDGKNISTMKSRALDRFRAEKIGFIFQAFFVQANETSYQNVALPLEIARLPRRERFARVERALSQVDLKEKLRAKAGTLSGGQKQRLAIARAIVNAPRLLFADEPTGNLDSVTGAKVEKLLFAFNKKLGSTLVIVTHDDELAAKCDVQIHIKDGRVQSINRTHKTKKETSHAHRR